MNNLSRKEIVKLIAAPICSNTKLSLKSSQITAEEILLNLEKAGVVMTNETKINHEEIFLKLKALILTLGRKGGNPNFEQGLFNLMDNIIDLEKNYLELKAENERLKIYERAFELAKRYIDETPCDPDIYPEQLKAYSAYQEILRHLPTPPKQD